MAWALAMIRGKEYGKGHDLHNDDIVRSMITRQEHGKMHDFKAIW